MAGSGRIEWLLHDELKQLAEEGREFDRDFWKKEIEACGTDKAKLMAVYEKIQEWIKSEHTYTVRFAIVILMKFFMDEHLDKKHLNLLLSIKTDEYYINMAIAWYLATALSSRWDLVIPYIENKKFEKWVHNKAIQKANESYRITKEQKEYLKTLKIK